MNTRTAIGALALTCCLGLAGSASAQLLTEDFEGSFPPTGWTLYQTGDPTDPGWVQTDLQANSGTYSAYHNDDDLAAAAISWIVTPQIALPATPDSHLHFWQYENWYSYYDYHGIWVSTGSCDPNDGAFSELVDLGVGVEDTWVQVDQSLATFAGQTLCIAFRYEGDFADEWYIDDVEINDVVPVELQAFTIE